MSSLHWQRAVLVIVGLGIVVAFSLVRVEPALLGSILGLWHLVDTTATILLLVCAAFAFWLWKLRIFSRWLVRIPNLQGEWTVHIAWDTGDKDATATVHQNLLRIAVNIRTDEITSRSTTASISVDDLTNEVRITYCYETDPKPSVIERNPRQRGTAVVDVISLNELRGAYYTDRGTKGSLTFVRSKN
jgi:hypothetical protein